jgi:hypothetical protein
VTWIELLLEANYRMKQSPIARLPLDIAIGRFAPLDIPTPIKSVVASSVPVVKQTAPVAVPPSNATPSPIPAEEAVDSVAVHETVSIPVAVEIPSHIPAEAWGKVLQALKVDAPSLVTSLAHAKVMDLQDEIIRVGVKYKMHADKINQAKNRLRVESAIESIMHAPMKLEAIVVKDLVVEDDSADVADVFDFEE